MRLSTVYCAATNAWQDYLLIKNFQIRLDKAIQLINLAGESYAILLQALSGFVFISI